MLTKNEKYKIEHGLLDIDMFPKELAVEFAAVKLSGARVVWINERWFLSRGLDITDHEVRSRLTHWLLDEFAYVVPDGVEPTKIVESDVKTFYADCYGSSEGAVHGGSGRVGTLGKFQAKGIGRTPLVGKSDWLHSHGALWLEEALREAVYAEICANEFPHGAVPIIAVIDTGLVGCVGPVAQVEPRGLAIRPFAIRPAYLERAVLFKPAGNEQYARTRDVARVRGMVRHFETTSELPLSEQLRQIFSKIAEQIAFARAHRLFPGNYASSNLTVTGALLDFGPFRAIPNWCRYIPMNDVEGFGDELPEIREFVSSICIYVNKYAQSAKPLIDINELLASYNEVLNRAWTRELLYLFHLENVGDPLFRSKVCDVVVSYYRNQQRSEVRFENGKTRKLDWFGKAFVAGITQELGPEEKGVLKRIWATIAELAVEHSLDIDQIYQNVTVTGARLLPERSALIRETLADSINRALNGNQTQTTPISLEDEINGQITVNRRHWPNVPREFLIKGQAVNPRCSMLHLIDPLKAEASIWIETVSIDGRVLWWNRWVDEKTVERHRVSVDSPGWYACVPLDSLNSNETAGENPLVFPSDALWFITGNYANLDKISNMLE